MSPHWIVDRDRIEAALQEHGFDIDPSDASLPEGGDSLSARMDKGDHTFVLKVDAGGRLVMTESEVLDDRAGDPIVIGNVKLAVTERSTRRRSYRGTLREISQLRSILKALLDKEGATEPPLV